MVSEFKKNGKMFFFKFGNKKETMEENFSIG